MIETARSGSIASAKSDAGLRLPKLVLRAASSNLPCPAPTGEKPSVVTVAPYVDAPKERECLSPAGLLAQLGFRTGKRCGRGRRRVAKMRWGTA